MPGLVRILKGGRGRVDDLWGTVETLGRMGPIAKDAVQTLIDGLPEWGVATGGMDDIHDRVWIRSRMAWALGRIGAKEAVPPLIKAVRAYDEEDHNPDLVEGSIKQAGIEALGNIGPAASEAVPTLIEALEDSNSDVRSTAAWALGRITAGGAGSGSIRAIKT